MIGVYRFVDGRVVPGSIADLESGHFVWVNMIEPTEDELHAVSAKGGVPLNELNELVGKDIRPTAHETETHSAIFFDAPSDDEDMTNAVGIFLLKNNNVVTLSNKQIPPLQKLEQMAKEDKEEVFQSQGSFARIYMDLITSQFFKVIDTFEDSVDEAEAAAFESPTRETEKKIFSNKKRLFTLHKSLLANREVVSAIEKEYITRISKKEAKKFRGVYDDIATLIDVNETLRDISTGILDVYLSSVSNNINTTMKKMTAWGSLILVPTLITGVYGMNFVNLPEAQWKFGYFFALGLMVLTVFVLLAFFKAKKYI